MKLDVKTMTSLFALITTIAGAIWGVDVMYARANDVEQKFNYVQNQITLTNSENAYSRAIKRKYDCEELLEKYPDNKKIKAQCAQTFAEVEKLQKKINSLETRIDEQKIEQVKKAGNNE